jgi:hypothetical protein
MQGYQVPKKQKRPNGNPEIMKKNVKVDEVSLQNK